MVLPDPIEDFGGLFEGQNDEHMLWFCIGAAAHGERRSHLGEADSGTSIINCRDSE